MQGGPKEQVWGSSRGQEEEEALKRQVAQTGLSKQGKVKRGKKKEPFRININLTLLDPFLNQHPTLLKIPFIKKGC